VIERGTINIEIGDFDQTQSKLKHNPLPKIRQEYLARSPEPDQRMAKALATHGKGTAEVTISTNEATLNLSLSAEGLSLLLQ
jgi:hypothetical protein